MCQDLEHAARILRFITRSMNKVSSYVCIKNLLRSLDLIFALFAKIYSHAEHRVGALLVILLVVQQHCFV